MKYSRLTFRVHAIQRMFQRKISRDDVQLVISQGETIEDYPTDTPYPSQLMLGWAGRRPIHVVVAYNSSDDEAIVVTAYEPDTAQWDANFRRRNP